MMLCMASRPAFRSYLLAIAFAIPVHLAFFLLAHDRLQPWYLDRSVDVQKNSANLISSDSDLYGRFARSLVERGKYAVNEAPVTSHMPGTSVLLALSKRLTGHLGGYGIIQTGVLFMGVLIYCRRAVRLFNPTAVTLGAFLFLVHPLVLFVGWTVNSDGVFVGVLLISLAVLMTSDPSRLRLCSAGVLLGVACYFREVALANILGAAGGVIKWRPFRLRASLLLMAAFLLVLGPWVTRNLLVTDAFVLTTTKSARMFFVCSLGISFDEVNPFDTDEGGAVSLASLGTHADALLAADGYGPGHPPSDAYFIRNGLRNYLTRPWDQAGSLAIKLANLLRPPVARRHLQALLPPGAATPIMLALWFQHAVLVWVGLVFLFRRTFPGVSTIRGGIVWTSIISLALWAEPRYLMPFYLPLFVLSLDRILARSWPLRQPAALQPSGPAHRDTQVQQGQ